MQVMNGSELLVKAQECLQNPNPDKPFEDYEKAFHWFNILLNTSYAVKDEKISQLYFLVGATSLKRDHKILAMLCFQKALELDPNFLEAINNLGYVHKKMEQHDEAAFYFKKAIDIAEVATNTQEDFIKMKADYYANFGSMIIARGRAQEALDIFNKGATYDPDHRLNKYNRSLAYLELGNYEDGFRDLDHGDRVDRVINRNYGQESLPFWDGTPGKRLVLIGEQGIGDEIMYCTLIKRLVKDCEIVIDAHPRLTNLFRRSFPDIDIYGTRKDESDAWGNRYQFDAKVLMGSLPKFYFKKKEDFDTMPYLEPDPVLVEKYRKMFEEMGDRPKIGISWKGGNHLTEMNNRFIPIDMFSTILKLPCDFISLQYDKNLEEYVGNFNKRHDVNLQHWPEILADYDETAALVKNLDFVISVPQSVVHLAGAMGTMCLQLTPFKAMWQMGVHGEDLPWYSTVASIWQDASCDWKPVLKQVEDELCNLLPKNI